MEKLQIKLNDWSCDKKSELELKTLVVAAHRGGYFSAGRIGDGILRQKYFGWSHIDKSSKDVLAYAILTKEILDKMIGWEGGVCPIDDNALILYKDGLSRFDVDLAGSISNKYWAKNIRSDMVVAYLPVEFELSEYVKFELKKNDLIELISDCSNFQHLNGVIDKFLNG